VTRVAIHPRFPRPILHSSSIARRLVLCAGALVLLPAPVAAAPAAPETLRAAVGRGLRFAVIGDAGAGTRAQHDVARRMCRWRRRHPFGVVVTTGDNVYPDGSRARFAAAWRRPYSCLRRAGVRWHATLGNHDVLTAAGRPELAAPSFGMRARNYVLRRGGVRLVMTDSNHLRMRWLRRATRAAPADRWTVVVFHHPVFSPGLHGSTPGLRPKLPRLFDRRGVDLVLNGHDHIYSVSKRLNGIRYVVTGGGGAPLYGCNRAWFTHLCRAEHHFLYVFASRRRVWVKAVPARGRVLDRFSVASSARAAPDSSRSSISAHEDDASPALGERATSLVLVDMDRHI
jgi:3',5'-cyclic AMP phosphodiesterase CpdA